MIRPVEYRREIDGLRALAVVPVILFHAGFPLFSGGFVGVDVFFVVSGFLITSLIVEEQARGSFTIAGFYERRVRRILPAMFVMLAASTVGAWLWLVPAEMKDFGASLASVSLFGSNLFFWLTSGYFSTAAELQPLLHTWSLSVEEQYYVLFPIAMTLAWKLGVRRVVIIAAVLGFLSVAAWVWFARVNPTAAFFLLPTRAWELVLGMLVAFYVRRGHAPAPAVREVLSMAGVALICASVGLLANDMPFPGWPPLVPTVGTALVLAYATRDTMAGRLLGLPLLVGIGLVSYSAYLWHQPLFAFARHGSVAAPGPGTYLILIALTFIAAFLSWRYVEMPARDRRRFSRRQVFGVGAVGSVTMLGVGMAIHAGNGLPGRFDAITLGLLGTSMQAYEASVSRCWERMLAAPSVHSGCQIGARTGTPRVAIVGDSHAGALLGELDAQLAQAGVAGVSYTLRSCPPLESGEPVRFTSGERECMHLRRSFFDELSGSAVPPVVVVSARWPLLMEKTRFSNGEGGVEHGFVWEWKLESAQQPYQAAMAANIAGSVAEILDSGRKVVLVYPVPEMGWDVPAHLAKLRMTLRRTRPEDGSVSHQAVMQRTRRAVEALDSLGEHPNLLRVRPERELCSAGRCIAHVGGVPLYLDNNHLSADGARLVVRHIMAALRASNGSGS